MKTFLMNVVCLLGFIGFVYGAAQEEQDALWQVKSQLVELSRASDISDEQAVQAMFDLVKTSNQFIDISDLDSGLGLFIHEQVLQKPLTAFQRSKHVLYGAGCIAAIFLLYKISVFTARNRSEYLSAYDILSKAGYTFKREINTNYWANTETHILTAYPPTYPYLMTSDITTAIDTLKETWRYDVEMPRYFMGQCAMFAGAGFSACWAFLNFLTALAPDDARKYNRFVKLQEKLHGYLSLNLNYELSSRIRRAFF